MTADIKMIAPNLTADALVPHSDGAALQPPFRRLGALRGRIRMAPDFDNLPPDILATMLGDWRHACSAR